MNKNVPLTSISKLSEWKLHRTFHADYLNWFNLDFKTNFRFASYVLRRAYVHIFKFFQQKLQIYKKFKNSFKKIQVLNKEKDITNVGREEHLWTWI